MPTLQKLLQGNIAGNAISRPGPTTVDVAELLAANLSV
jgi:hypothetical protein